MQLIHVLLVSLLLLTACTSVKCESDSDCGYSCTYGCVSAAWYSTQVEKDECSTAKECGCVDGKCAVVG